MLRALLSVYTRTPAPLYTAPAAAARSFITPPLASSHKLASFPSKLQIATMSSKDDQQPAGMATEGLPKGPEIKEHSQINEEHPAIGIQKEMETPPEISRLPTQHGHQDVLALEEYVGVGKLKGRRVIITGGDSGIGLSAAVMMARERAHGIAIVYHPSEQQDADAAQKMIKTEGSECLLMPVDLSEGEPVAKRIIEEVVGAWGKVDILVNNAAIQHIVPSVTDCDPEVLEKTFKVNLFPMFYLTKHAVPHMVRGSTIINTTSVVAYNGSPSLLEYSSTKGAIVAFTRSLAKQLAPKGIRVNAVAPGPVS
jgi:NAD(P)-dependent dehydrogenase (short-subunit alcohol dehydrogenase family)